NPIRDSPKEKARRRCAPMLGPHRLDLSRAECPFVAPHLARGGIGARVEHSREGVCSLMFIGQRVLLRLVFADAERTAECDEKSENNANGGCNDHLWRPRPCGVFATKLYRLPASKRQIGNQA